MTNTSAPLNSLASFSFSTKPPPVRSRRTPPQPSACPPPPPLTRQDTCLFDGPRRGQTPVVLILVLARDGRIDRAADRRVVGRRRDGGGRRGHGGGIKALALRNAKVNVGSWYNRVVILTVALRPTTLVLALALCWDEGGETH